jgi:hypothetical protein
VVVGRRGDFAKFGRLTLVARPSAGFAAISVNSSSASKEIAEVSNDIETSLRRPTIDQDDSNPVVSIFAAT